MFTNKGRPQDSNLPAIPEPAPRRQAPGRAGIASIIANGVKITGTIDADGAEVQVDGEVEGNIRGGSLTVGDTGMVKGDVVSESVTVHGRVEGSVRARKVMLARNAHVLGDIVHQSLSVEMGAVFEGQCRYLQDPLSQSGQGAPAQPQVTPAATQYGAAPGSVFGEPAEDRMVSGVIVTGTSN
ncbi:MAG TPA: polymer-forming cytoskeletal protein [Terricaulis sp.]|nr:polymer-forming cytoskeletal protein [Terricaulis sp.]HRP10654.1 polymer-forming cytoskeletal protein [Terricaulis sp.]